VVQFWGRRGVGTFGCALCDLSAACKQKEACKDDACEGIVFHSPNSTNVARTYLKMLIEESMFCRCL